MAQKVSVICWCDENVHAFSIEVRGTRAEVTGQSKIPCRVPDSLFASHNPSELIEASARALEEANSQQGRVTLVLPMQWCFLQSLEKKASKKSDETLAFEFEPFLPVALEDITCTFVRSSGKSCLGLAIPTRPMAELLEQFAAAGIEVDHIAVDALVAMDLQTRNNMASPIIIQDARWIRAALIDPASKSLVTAIAGTADVNAGRGRLLTRLGIAEQQAEELMGSAVILNVGGVTEDSTLHESQAKRDVQPQNTWQLIDLAKFAALNLMQADLRTGDLSGTRSTEEISKLARHCIGLAALLFAVFSGSLFLQTRTLTRHQSQIDAQKLSVYQQVIETTALPPSAAMRLASERVRLEGLARTDVVSSKLKEAVLPPPFVALRNIVEALPNDVPILLNETRIDEQQLSMRGQTREHRDAERIVEAINKVSGIKALAPRTNRLKTGGVEFSINAGAGNEQ